MSSPFLTLDPRPSQRPVAVTTTAAVAPQRVLIVNTNGGGHANIGFWLAKTLAAQGHSVTINVVGSQDDAKMQKPPFSYFSELTSAGVTTCWANPEELATKAAGQSFDVVVDNNGKDLDTVGPVADFAVSAGAKQFLFVSSAGMYVPTDTPPHLEGDAVKESAGHAKVEAMLKTKPFAMSSFRPQYFTGYGNNKDCEEWFFDRLVRGRPVPIPGSGDQLSVVAHAEDVATMMAAAVGCDAAAGQIFNAVTNRAVTLNGMVKICAAAAGVEPNIVNYDPDTLPEGVAVKKAFPFRPIHFYSHPKNALELLDWKPTHTLETDMKERFAFYQQSGRGGKDMAFEMDDAILASAKRY
jgi:nucleoside-diphosphate-sugar epimerase